LSLRSSIRSPVQAGSPHHNPPVQAGSPHHNPPVQAGSPHHNPPAQAGSPHHNPKSDSTTGRTGKTASPFLIALAAPVGFVHADHIPPE
jgi:hypothetical protein